MPSTYLMALYNGLAGGNGVDGNTIVSLLVLIATGVLAFFLAVYLFSWDAQNKSHRRGPVLALAVLLPLVAGSILLK